MLARPLHREPDRLCARWKVNLCLPLGPRRSINVCVELRPSARCSLTGFLRLCGIEIELIRRSEIIASHNWEEAFLPRAGSAGRIPKEKRIRDPAHLAFVASQPCLICGRRPAQAHHLRFAQPRAMAMKVSDEFTVPVCNTHHDQLHRSGDERAFWARQGFRDPLKYAARLWEASRNQRKGATHRSNGTLDPDLEAEFSEPYLRKGSGAAARST